MRQLVFFPLPLLVILSNFHNELVLIALYEIYVLRAQRLPISCKLGPPVKA